MHKSARIGFVAVGLALLAQAPSAGNYAFTSIDFPSSVGSIREDTLVSGINDHGQIVGSHVAEGTTITIDGFLLSQGVFTLIDVPASDYTRATGINNVGQIVGDAGGVRLFGSEYFLLNGGTFSPVLLPGLPFGIGVTDSGSGGGPKINNRGEVLANTLAPGFFLGHGLLFSERGFTEIAPPGSVLALAWGLNDKDEVVGSYRAGDVNAYDQGYLFSAGAYTNINVPGGLWTLAAGINNNGQIVGAYLPPRLGARGFVLSHGIFNSIDFPGAAQTLPWDINNIGQIVGIYEDTRNHYAHGFVATPNYAHH